MIQLPQICCEYDPVAGKTTDVKLVMTIESEVRLSFEGGRAIFVGERQFILWGRKLDTKQKVVIYQMIEL